MKQRMVESRKTGFIVALSSYLLVALVAVPVFYKTGQSWLMLVSGPSFGFWNGVSSLVGRPLYDGEVVGVLPWIVIVSMMFSYGVFPRRSTAVVGTLGALAWVAVAVLLFLASAHYKGGVQGGAEVSVSLACGVGMCFVVGR